MKIYKFLLCCIFMTSLYSCIDTCDEDEVVVTDDDVYHKCVHCWRVNEDNFGDTMSEEEAISEGYEPCSWCMNDN